MRWAVNETSRRRTGGFKIGNPTLDKLYTLGILLLLSLPVILLGPLFLYLDVVSARATRGRAHDLQR